MKRVGEFVPSSTYFEDREKKLTERASKAAAEIAEYKVKFETMTRDLVDKRDTIIASLNELQLLRTDLTERAAQGRAAVQELLATIVQCETLSADLTEFMAAPEAAAAALDEEIIAIEKQLRKSLSKPARESAKLQLRLAYLRVRKSIVERQVEVKEPSEAENSR